VTTPEELADALDVYLAACPTPSNVRMIAGQGAVGLAAKMLREQSATIAALLAVPRQWLDNAAQDDPARYPVMQVAARMAAVVEGER